MAWKVQNTMPVSPASPATGSGRDRASASRSKTVGERFLIGEEIGKGAHGMVYKGIDLHNGDFVAVKQVSLEGMNQQDLASIMVEIDLLKNLRHKNIVKYLGSYKTKNHLYIFLEYAENGALAGIIKPNKFGAFPESLVAVYMSQVLEGLAYLHEQGVIHRDVKGANILITKEGLVKLADFGVATKLSDAEVREQSVVGTPYWMAPEVIEMAGVSAASDIWSVGCTAIELLTCSPPYYDLQPLTALFKIVRDEVPPLPEGISPVLKDFLLLCFRKDPKLRPSAKELLSHPWLQHSRHKLRARTMPTPVDEKTPRSVARVVERVLETDSEDSPPQDSRKDEELDEVLVADGVMHVHVNGISEKQVWKSQGTAAMVSQGVGVEPRQSLAQEYHHAGVSTSQKESEVSRTRSSFSLEAWLDKMNEEKDLEVWRPDGGYTSTPILGHDGIEVSSRMEDEGSMLDEDTPTSVEISNNISHLQPDKRDGVIISSCQKLVQIFQGKPESKFLPTVNRMVVPIVDLLQISNEHVILSILELLNVVGEDNSKLRKKLCMCGILPRLCQFATDRQHEKVRYEVAKFCGSMCAPSALGVEAFLAGNGIPILVELLKQKPDIKNHEAALLAIEAIENIFDIRISLSIQELSHLLANLGLVKQLFSLLSCLVQKWRQLEGLGALKVEAVQMATDSKYQPASAQKTSDSVSKFKTTKPSSHHNPRRSLTSIFYRKGKTHSKSAVPSSAGVVEMPAEPDIPFEVPEISPQQCVDMMESIARLLLIFSHGDVAVKLNFCMKENLVVLFATLGYQPNSVSNLMIRALKHLSLEASALDFLQEEGAIPVLVKVLISEESSKEVKKEALATLYNLCKVSKARQEEAAMSGAVPYLKQVGSLNDQMKQLAVPLLCGMVHASKQTRAKLLKHNVLELYLRLLEDRQWNIVALEAVASWMAVEPTVVLPRLLKKETVDRIVGALKASSEAGSGPFLHTLELLLRMLPRSSKFTTALAVSELPQFIVSMLGSEDAIIKLHLLRLLRLVYQHHPAPKTLIYQCGLEERLQALAGGGDQEEPILVRQMAQNILDSLKINTVL